MREICMDCFCYCQLVNICDIFFCQRVTDMAFFAEDVHLLAR